MKIELQTKKELDLLLADLKKLSVIFRFFSIGIYIVFCIYKLAINSGILPLNIALLCISLTYLVLAVVFVATEKEDERKQRAHRLSRKAYHYVRLSALAFSAVLAIAGLLTASERVTLPAILLAVALPTCTVLQVALDLGVYYFTDRIRRFETALTQDIEALKRDAREIAVELIRNMVFPKKEKSAEEEPQIVGCDDLKELKKAQKTAGTKEVKEEKGKKERRGGLFAFFRRKKKTEEVAFSDDQIGETKKM